VDHGYCHGGVRGQGTSRRPSRSGLLGWKEGAVGAAAFTNRGPLGHGWLMAASLVPPTCGAMPLRSCCAFFGADVTRTRVEHNGHAPNRTVSSIVPNRSRMRMPGLCLLERCGAHAPVHRATLAATSKGHHCTLEQGQAWAVIGASNRPHPIWVLGIDDATQHPNGPARQMMAELSALPMVYRPKDQGAARVG
jgi:hypothetical protein